MSTLDLVKKYFTTIQGWLSVVPSIAALFDLAKGWMPIASAIKPWVYLVIVLLTAFSVWLEVSRFVEIQADPSHKTQMRKRAIIHMLTGVALIGAYWVAAEYFNAFMPEQIVYRTAILFLLTLLVGSIFAEVTRAFCMLALTSH